MKQVLIGTINGFGFTMNSLHFFHYSVILNTINTTNINYTLNRQMVNLIKGFIETQIKSSILQTYIREVFKKKGFFLQGVEQK